MQTHLSSFFNLKSYSLLPSSNVLHSQVQDNSIHIVPNSISTQLKGLSFTLLPTWIQRCLQKNGQPSNENKLHSTAWLDGLRGYAALVVTLLHYSLPQHMWDNPYSFSPLGADENPLEWTSYLQLPIVRLWQQGKFSVAIFLVISGYVLSFRKVGYIREKNMERLLESMVSSIVRRPIRLFLPVIGGLFFMQLGESFGLYTRLMSGWPHPEELDSVTPSRSWMNLAWRIWNIGDAVFETHSYKAVGYGLLQFWTIPLEVADSLVMFIIIIGLCRMSYNTRVLIASAIAIMTWLNTRWAVSLYLVGYIIAETESNRTSPYSSILTTFFWSLMLVISLFLGSLPSSNVDRDSLLWWTRNLSPIDYSRAVDLDYAALSVAAALLVKSLFRLPRLQGMFTTKFALYMGDLSYSIYAVHYISQYTLRPSLRILAVFIVGEPTTNFSKDMGMILQLLISTFFSIWIADLIWRLVDKTSVNFSKWVEMSLRNNESEKDCSFQLGRLE